MNTHGGARIRSGRPKMLPEHKRQKILILLNPALARKFRTQIPWGLRSVYIETLLREALK
jgi:hypothetical protein